MQVSIRNDLYDTVGWLVYGHSMTVQHRWVILHPKTHMVTNNKQQNNIKIQQAAVKTQSSPLPDYCDNDLLDYAWL